MHIILEYIYTLSIYYNLLSILSLQGDVAVTYVAGVCLRTYQLLNLY